MLIKYFKKSFLLFVILFFGLFMIVGSSYKEHREEELKKPPEVTGHVKKDGKMYEEVYDWKKHETFTRPAPVDKKIDHYVEDEIDYILQPDGKSYLTLEENSERVTKEDDEKEAREAKEKRERDSKELEKMEEFNSVPSTKSINPIILFAPTGTGSMFNDILDNAADSSINNNSGDGDGSNSSSGHN